MIVDTNSWNVKDISDFFYNYWKKHVASIGHHTRVIWRWFVYTRIKIVLLNSNGARMFHLELMCINGEYSTALMKQTFRGDSKRSLYREFVTWESRNQALIKSSYLNHLSLFCSINPRITKILQNIIRPNFSFTQIHPGSDLIVNSFRSIIPQNPVRFYKPIVF